jgi:nitrate reductase (cytochrome), electron transfer subunit
VSDRNVNANPNPSTPASPATDRGRARRVRDVGLALVLGLALVGFLEGTRPTTIAPALFPSSRAPETTEAVPGQTYRQLRDRRFGPNHRVTAELELLRADIPDVLDFVPISDEARASARAARAERRAFDGAPPVVPHVIDEQSATSCLACHERGIVVEGRTAPVLSHAIYQNCTQCHVPAVARSMPPAVTAQNGFVGLASRGRGGRAWDGAPPTNPHPIWMRQNCGSCHGVTGLAGLRTPHPARQSCEQCHPPAVAAQPRMAQPDARKSEAGLPAD